MNKQKIHIVGGGLVGPLTAIFLARHGFDVALYERRHDMRKAKISAGKSINLVVTPRGFVALDKVGLREKVLKLAIPLEGRMLHDVKGVQTYVAYGQKDGEVIHAVSRGLLNQLLLQAADSYDNLDIYFEKRCVDYDVNTRVLSFVNEKTGAEEKVETDIVIGTDGAFSALRRVMMDNIKNFDYAQYFQTYGYKELVIPAGKNGAHPIKSGVFHIWPRGNYMLISIPNLDGSFTCTLFLPYAGEKSFKALKTKEDVTAFFHESFPDAMRLMPTLTEDFFDNPTGALATIKCFPWHIGAQAMLLGDAAHAIVPFYGQGMNCGFEDCTALGDLLESGITDWNVIFTKLGAGRKPNTDAIADMAIANFTEMSETTADPKFQMKKKVGFALENRFPEYFIPRYSMVMFHPEISFAEAKRLGALQDQMLDDLCANINDPDEIDWKRVETLLKNISLHSPSA